MPYCASQWPWIFGERECAIGWPVTNAFFSAIDGSQCTQFLQHRQERQADDRKIVAFYLFEELDALALDLVGADACQGLCADARQVPADEGGIEFAHGEAGDADMAPQ